MAKVSGHGGYWIREGDAHLQGDLANATIHNAEYELEVDNQIYEARTAGCGNWTEGLPVINRVTSMMMMVAEDDTAYPQALGLTQGAELTIYLKRGELDEFDRVTNTIVRTVTIINDQQKARRVRIVCQHGLYKRDTAAPPEPA